MDAVSNMMIERLRLKVGSDDWESQFTEDRFTRPALPINNVSTPLCAVSDFVRYYEPYLNT